MTDQNFGLGAKVGVISFDRSRLEDDRRQLVRAMFSRALVFQHPFEAAALGFYHESLAVKPPLPGKMSHVALLSADNPERSRTLHKFPGALWPARLVVQRDACKAGMCWRRNCLKSQAVNTSSI